MRKLTYKQMREHGICPKCGKENDTPEKSMCTSCRTHHNEQRKANRKYRSNIGMCTRCGRHKAEPYKKLCYECLDKDNEKYHSKDRTEADRENDREKKRQQAAERKESGCCIRCGRPYHGEKNLCTRCRGYLKNYRDNHRQDICRSERTSYGICYICGSSDVMDGKKVCESCYEDRLKTLPMMWANQNNEYFRRLETARIEKVRAKRGVVAR